MHRLLLILTFLQSAATILLERGLYFYTESRLHFSDIENLILALLFGTMYAAGALNSHRITASRGEKPTLRAILLGLLLLMSLMLLSPGRLIIWGGFAGIGLLEGMKWPIIESYLTAGATPARAMKVLGRFNVAWSSAVPLSLIVAGPMMGSGSPRSFIVLALLLHVVGLMMIIGLPVRPAHLPTDHPERPDPDTTCRYRALLTASRWSMLGGYAMMFLLAPLLPTIFTDRLGHSVSWAPGLSSVMDCCRLAAFIFLGVVTAWRGRRLPLIVCAFGLPIGFLMVLFAQHTATAIAGQIIFGFGTGMVYYAAIYHAMVLANASVEAGGEHEGLIGSGFALGPAVGLLGLGLQHWIGGEVWPLLLAVSPFIVLIFCLSIRPLLSFPAANDSAGKSPSQPLN